MEKKIQSMKGIAQYISEKTNGLEITVDWVKWHAYSKKEDDRLPIEPRFAGGVYALASKLDQWIARQWGKSRAKHHKQTEHPLHRSIGPAK